MAAAEVEAGIADVPDGVAAAKEAFGGKLKDVWPVGVGVGVDDGDLTLSGLLSLKTVKTTSCLKTSKSHVMTDPF